MIEKQQLERLVTLKNEQAKHDYYDVARKAKIKDRTLATVIEEGKNIIDLFFEGTLTEEEFREACGYTPYDFKKLLLSGYSEYMSTTNELYIAEKEKMKQYDMYDKSGNLIPGMIAQRLKAGITFDRARTIKSALTGGQKPFLDWMESKGLHPQEFSKQDFMDYINPPEGEGPQLKRGPAAMHSEVKAFFNWLWRNDYVVGLKRAFLTMTTFGRQKKKREEVKDYYRVFFADVEELTLDWLMNKGIPLDQYRELDWQKKCWCPNCGYEARKNGKCEQFECPRCKTTLRRYTPYDFFPPEGWVDISPPGKKPKWFYSEVNLIYKWIYDNKIGDWRRFEILIRILRETGLRLAHATQLKWKNMLYDQKPPVITYIDIKERGGKKVPDEPTPMSPLLAKRIADYIAIEKERGEEEGFEDFVFRLDIGMGKRSLTMKPTGRYLKIGSGSFQVILKKIRRRGVRVTADSQGTKVIKPFQEAPGYERRKIKICPLYSYMFRYSIGTLYENILPTPSDKEAFFGDKPDTIKQYYAHPGFRQYYKEGLEKTVPTRDDVVTMIFCNEGLYTDESPYCHRKPGPKKDTFHILQAKNDFASALESLR